MGAANIDLKETVKHFLGNLLSSWNKKPDAPSERAMQRISFAAPVSRAEFKNIDNTLTPEICRQLIALRRLGHKLGESNLSTHDPKELQNKIDRAPQAEKNNPKLLKALEDNKTMLGFSDAQEEELKLYNIELEFRLELMSNLYEAKTEMTDNIYLKEQEKLKERISHVLYPRYNSAD